MGRDSRLRMSDEEREHKALAWTMQRMYADTIHDPGVNDMNGCPKCGVPSAAFEKQFHLGIQPETEKIADACKYDGEHLHVRCKACGFMWLERPRDWQFPEDA